MRRFRILSLLALASAVGAGCTLVNSYDEVKPRREAVYTSGPKAEAPLDEAGAVVEAGTDAGDAGPTEDHRVLVVAGVVDSPDAGGRAPVLTVLDPLDGREIGAREAMHVAAIAHEAKRDLWYIFESPSSFITAPSDVVLLHIRKLDSATGEWTELSKTLVPTIYFYESYAVTNDRLTFAAHPADGGSPRMVTFDTSDPAAPKQIDERTLAALPVGMIGTPGGAGAGGQVALVNTGTAAAGECEAGQCAAKVRRFLIPTSGPVLELGSYTVGSMLQFGTLAYGSMACGGPDEMLILPKGGEGPHTLHLVDYTATTPRLSLDFTMNANSTLLRRAAIDNSRGIAFVVEANTDTNIHAIKFDGTTPSVKAPLRHSGQSVYYDPASETAFAPFNQGDGYTFSAFKVSIATTGAVQLRERIAPPDGDWNPPPDLRPILLGIRNPASFDCP